MSFAQEAHSITQEFFRTEAIEAQARLDRLPQTMRVTSSLTKATLAVLGCGLLVATAWSAFVEVPVRVLGNGLFVDSSGDLLKPVRTPMEGMIERLLVSEGDKVRAGQAVARIRLPDREAALRKAERNLTALGEQLARTLKLQEIERFGDDRARQVKVKSLDKRIADLEVRLAWNRERELAQDQLLSKGVTTRIKAIDAKAATLQAIDQIAVARGELSALLADVLVTEGRERERLVLQVQLEQAKSEIAGLRSELERGSTLSSPVDGTVGELSADRNGLITAGQTIMSVIPTNANSNVGAIAYVSLADGKLIKAGDQVLVRPGSLPHSEQGMIRAIVTDVSDAPVSERALNRMLGNQGLVSKASNGEAPFAVRIALVKDAGTSSGYSWTSGEGPKIRLTPGTPISARITVERSSLMALAIPALRRLLMDSDEGWAGRKS